MIFYRFSLCLVIDEIIQSYNYDRLSRDVSLDLISLHHFTSGQVSFPSIKPLSLHQFQLPTRISVREEHSFDSYLLRSSQTTKIEQEILSIPTDTKKQILQQQILYLQKQHADAVALGDFAQQLAAERAIENKLQRIEGQHLIAPSHISLLSATTSETSVAPSHIDRQVRGVLKSHVRSLQTKMQKLPRDHREDSKPLEVYNKMVNSVEDLRQLSKIIMMMIIIDGMNIIRFRSELERISSRK